MYQNHLKYIMLARQELPSTSDEVVLPHHRSDSRTTTTTSAEARRMSDGGFKRELMRRLRNEVAM